MILLIFSFEIINVVTPDSNIFLWIAGSVADAALVNPNCIKTVLANGIRTSPIKGNPVFSNPPKSLPKNRVLFYAIEFLSNFTLADELFAKVLQSFETCVLVNNNLSGKLFSSLESPKSFEDIFKVTSISFFILDLNL